MLRAESRAGSSVMQSCESAFNGARPYSTKIIFNDRPQTQEPRCHGTPLGKTMLQQNRIKIIETFQDCQLRPSNYMRQVKRGNPNRYKEALNGMHSLNDILFLQVRGKSQIQKELEETNHLRNHKEILYYKDALKSPESHDLDYKEEHDYSQSMSAANSTDMLQVGTEPSVKGPENVLGLRKQATVSKKTTMVKQQFDEEIY